MPELPEVETVRRALEPVMEGARFTRVILRREGLRRPFPPDFAGRLERRTVRALRRRGKYLLAELSSGETLLMHLGMSGSFRVDLDAGATARGGDADGADRHDHVVFRMSSGAAVTFNDPRRFGVMDLVPRGQLAQHPALGAIGPEPLAPDSTAPRSPVPAPGSARRSRSRCSINASSPGSATSMRARRSIGPACRRAGAPRRSRRRPACRSTAPIASRGDQAGPAGGDRAEGRRLRIARRAFASTIERASAAAPRAARGRSGGSRSRDGSTFYCPDCQR